MKVMIASKFVNKIKDLFASLWTDNSGNVEVGKNLVVDGTIQQNTYKVDSPLGIVLGQDKLDQGFAIFYQHARVSNGKLNIVIGLSLAHPAAAYAEDLVYTSLVLPADVYSKLHPAFGTNYLGGQVLDSPLIQDSGYIADVSSHNSFAECIIRKVDNFQIQIGLLANSLSNTENNYCWRFEFNFTLS